LNLGTVVVHPRKGAAAANKEGSAMMAGPFIQQPKISTGAGDHFNAGFCAGQLLGMNLEESLAVGVGTSGYYVRNAESPTAAKLAGFIAEMPSPQV
jgi:sugar/nucleoside kinase (ribokinase family)